MDTKLRQGSAGRYLLDWIAPALFALLVSTTIRVHSLAPMPTMSRTVGHLLALSALAFLLLLARGRRIDIPRDVVFLLLALAASATVSVVGSGGIHYFITALRALPSSRAIGDRDIPCLSRPRALAVGGLFSGRRNGAPAVPPVGHPVDQGRGAARSGRITALESPTSRTSGSSPNSAISPPSAPQVSACCRVSLSYRHSCFLRQPCSA